ncbi:hypothetical protein [Pectobacterium wasabiae]|uniref:Colicin immunity protein n=1 Tax=Pectobacterium wasabiae TaxID=55208 RepID=A0AAW3EBD4_9GAMM|nr:hypothetical protein [Pectobacterium wasabiae]AOR62953.1 hypothetical protein A7983_06730 [Pectobacterium wasabiae CFBP 3304]EJS93642.1 Hypothetical protein Y17_3100 [Pectobacterium wasabiae CFBP 3304]KFX02433.1 hypothetical protein JV38_22155 [Pectobacterium wasabiae]KGA26357.1 hypothetical protein KU73_21630 [Pectobacterium wasabiae]
MLEEIKEKIIKNSFVDEIRTNMAFNEDAYMGLISSLGELSNILKGSDFVDKELALYLYTIPQMIRNAYVSFDGKENNPEIEFRLEDAWIELDALVIDCLS